jgi:hypothetical protein
MNIIFAVIPPNIIFAVENIKVFKSSPIKQYNNCGEPLV